MAEPVKFTAPSGAEVIINVADWPDAKKLKKAIQRELADSGINLDLNADASFLISALMRVDASDAVEAALAPCLARCLRNGEQIKDIIFNDPEARKDYYDIVYKCAEANIRPLLQSLLSVLKPALESMAKSESIPTLK